MPTAAIVPAAGAGLRLGPGAPKALRRLRGEPLLVHAVRALVAAPAVSLVVVAARSDDLDAVRTWLAPVMGQVTLEVVVGGAQRQDSVAAALAVLPAAVDVVLVHDAARPLAPPALVQAVADAVLEGDADAVVPGLPVADTVKQVDADGTVLATPDRAGLRAVQTPQGFRRSVLAAAHAAAGQPHTDDAGLVESIGGRVRVVAGDPEAFKVTGPLDLALAEAVLARRAVQARRTAEAAIP